MKHVGAAVVLTDGDKVLMCHVTHQHHWDLPKGRRDGDESPFATATREFYEETGIHLTELGDIRRLGKYHYSDFRDMEVFMVLTEDLPDVSKMKCESMFTSKRDGKQYPEMDDFQYMSWEDAIDSSIPNMSQMLRKILTVVYNLIDI